MKSEAGLKNEAGSESSLRWDWVVFGFQILKRIYC